MPREATGIMFKRQTFLFTRTFFWCFLWHQVMITTKLVITKKFVYSIGIDRGEFQIIYFSYLVPPFRHTHFNCLDSFSNVRKDYIEKPELWLKIIIVIIIINRVGLFYQKNCKLMHIQESRKCVYFYQMGRVPISISFIFYAQGVTEKEPKYILKDWMTSRLLKEWITF